MGKLIRLNSGPKELELGDRTQNLQKRRENINKYLREIEARKKSLFRK
ncbi:hypothetical protein [Litchfieldia salsa]|uniref:Uncharacterized protein n=1 Tax=Litchfieldia salsa TaxID=930152 RepID=A0A1H0T791_9BACI|nr:hypothetical protein [Litchfieldia salsa]SDP49681.1 hypothetical protein SAMN05216565_103313 [Litchfieldia salsa]